MANCVIKTFCFFLLIINYINGQQRYTTNTDFLNHEGSRNPTESKRDYESQFPSLNAPVSGTTGQPNNITPPPKRDYVAPQFPPLNSPSLVNAANTGQQNRVTTPPKRDYVAPQFPPLKVPISGNAQPLPPQNNPSQPPKRDYVAPQFPPLNSPSLVNAANTGQQNRVTTPPKRDYVAPNFPPLSSPTGNLGTQGTSQPPKRDYVAPHFPPLSTPISTNTNPAGSQIIPNQPPKRDYVAPQPNKVKDLVNFYDNKGKDQNGPNKTPSYSSVVHGSTGQTGTRSTTKINQPITPSPGITKPFSFSDIVSGGNKPSTPLNPKAPPYVPTNPGNKPNSQVGGTQPKPGPVLPSTIVQNNKKTTTETNGPSDTELQTLSEELLRKDINNAAKYITINHQEKTTSQSKEDKASLPLLTVTDEAWNIPTVKKIIPLLDNYERDTLVNEHVTAQERNEEIAFMDAIMATSVIRHLMTFLKDKGYVTPDPRQQRDFVKQLWFTLYSRGKGKISSSGFEHIFVSELKNGEISGLHNWIYFSREETANRVNYLGYLKYEQLNDKGTVMKLHFNQQGVDKPVDSMFIGTSPELEMALYTLCFVTRSDNDCTLRLGGKNVVIVTHTFRYRSKNLIGSAYPQI